MGRTMRRFTAVVAVGAIAFVLSGCSDPGADMVGPTWQWTHLNENHPKSQSVIPDPENYTLTLADDGTFTAKADCNQVSGTYDLQGDSLTITPGPSTRAACGADSLDQQFVSLLHAVSNFTLDGSDLTLGLAADAGDMGFVQA